MNTNDPELSIVVVTLKDWNEIVLTQTLCEEQLERCEIVIRDDEGICTARNAGIEEATSDRIVFLDDDSTPCDDYVDRAIEALDEYDAVAGRVIDTGHSWIGKTVSHYDQGDETKLTKTVVGCNMGFRRKVFEAIGGFDESIQWGHDETELVDRVTDEFDICYVPQLEVKHPYSTGFLDYAKKRYKLGLADVYYWKKQEKNVTQEVLNSMISPRTYIDYTIRGTLMKLPTGFMKVYGQLSGYNRLRKGKSVFDGQESTDG